MARDLSSDRERINAWFPAYQYALKQVGQDSRTRTLGALIDIAWEQGILEHVSPKDHEIRRIRARSGATLWPVREDPFFHVRMQYSLEADREDI